jgi:hypothetical protein
LCVSVLYVNIRGSTNSFSKKITTRYE